MIQIQFFSLLRMLLKQEKLDLPAIGEESVAQLLHRAQQQLSIPFLHKLLDKDGNLHPGTIILINRRNILHLEELQTPVNDNDVVGMFPPGAGG
jgi:molybdopterin synthase sulfur carrier subunit